MKELLVNAMEKGQIVRIDSNEYIILDLIITYSMEANSKIWAHCKPVQYCNGCGKYSKSGKMVYFKGMEYCQKCKEYSTEESKNYHSRDYYKVLYDIETYINIDIAREIQILEGKSTD